MERKRSLVPGPILGLALLTGTPPTLRLRLTGRGREGERPSPSFPVGSQPCVPFIQTLLLWPPEPQQLYLTLTTGWLAKGWPRTKTQLAQNYMTSNASVSASQSLRQKGSLSGVLLLIAWTWAEPGPHNGQQERPPHPTPSSSWSSVHCASSHKAPRISSCSHVLKEKGTTHTDWTSPTKI